MRDYAKVAPQFWIGRTGKALRKAGPEAQIVALYLMTNPHANMLGLYYIAMNSIAHETGLGDEGATKGLARAIEAGFCSYDEASEVVFVHEMARFQIAEQLEEKDNRCKGIQNEYDSLTSNPFLPLFFDRYAISFHLKKKREASSPIQAPCKPHRSQEQEHEHEQEVTSLVPSGTPDCPHDEIIAAYHEALPTCPRVKVWTDKRKAALRSRWRENAKHYKTAEDGIAWWRKFFGYVSESAFLTGRAQTNGRPFLADLEWLTNSANFVKIIEGKYHA